MVQKRKSGQILELNKKLYEAIHGVMGFTPDNFTLYADKNQKTPLSGQKLLDKMSQSKGGDKQIYNVNGNPVLDLSKKATNSALQVLFGINPEYMVSKDKGLRKVNTLYMDGLGNIWGSYGSASVSDYILVLPASLNPIVFPTSKGSFSLNADFPVSNVFSMGATVKIKDNFLHGKTFRTPYYNMKQYFSAEDNANLINIFGIQSPLNHIGNSSGLITSLSQKSNPKKDVDSFLSEDTSDTVNKSKANVLVSIDGSKLGDLGKHIKELDMPLEQKSELVTYLTGTQVFKLDEIADDMYYFNVPLAPTENASGSSEGSFDNVNDLIRKQTLFAKEAGSGKYEFYSKSSIPSPFNAFIKDFREKAHHSRMLLCSVVLV